MIAPGRVNASLSSPRLVAVIRNAADLARARRLRRQPDFFEIRLDAFSQIGHRMAAEFAALPAPLLLTARSAAEGSPRSLTINQRRKLLERFLSLGAALDIELRSAPQLSSLLRLARQRALPVILSRHDLHRTPSLPRLLALARQAHSLGASAFKIATRTDRPEQLARLMELMAAAPLPVSAMGLGKLGRESRRLLLRAGSVLNYGHLGRAAVPGQLSLPELFRLLPRIAS